MLLMPQNIGAGNSIYVKEPKIKNYNPNKPMHNLTTLLMTHLRCIYKQAWPRPGSSSTQELTHPGAHTPRSSHTQELNPASESLDCRPSGGSLVQSGPVSSS